MRSSRSKAVQTAPHLFLPDGAGDEEIAAARAQLLEREIEMSVAAAGSAPSRSAEDRPLDPPADLVVCTQEVISSSVGPVREGSIFHKNDRRVIAVPEAFRPLLEADLRCGGPVMSGDEVALLLEN